MTNQHQYKHHITLIFVWIALSLAALHIGNVASQPAPKNIKAQPKPDVSAMLNLALRQPMLAERSTKSFLMLTRNVMVLRSRNQLEESLAEFEANLNTLKAAAPNKEIRENYELLEQLFDEFKGIKQKPVNNQSATELAEQNEELVWISQKGANLWQAQSKSPRNDLIATAGEARVLTQRLAKLYLFRASGIRSAVIANDLKKAEADYRNAVERLLSAPQNTEEIKRDLALAETQWLFLKQAIERLNANRTSATELEHAGKTCDNILQVMENVAQRYAFIKG
jgi:DNA repair exonuclease SbcCD ATPase subunit